MPAGAGVIFAALTFARAHWRWFACGLALLAVAWLWHSRSEWRQTARQWQSTAQAWKTAFGAQKSAYEAAQAAARAKLDAQRKVLKNDYDTIAERADNAERKVNSLVAASERYARANRVRSQAVAGNGGRSTAAGQGDGASGDNGPGEDAVVVPAADFRILVENTGRLIKAHDWYEDLRAKGLAEATPEPVAEPAP